MNGIGYTISSDGSPFNLTFPTRKLPECMNAFPTKHPRRSGTDLSVPKGGFSFNLPFLVLVGFGMHKCIPYEAYRHFASISACAGIGESVTLLVGFKRGNT